MQSTQTSATRNGLLLTITEYNSEHKEYENLPIFMALGEHNSSTPGSIQCLGKMTENKKGLNSFQDMAATCGWHRVDAK